MNLDFWRGKNVFITGHTGFKGAWMCHILSELGANVTGYALPAPTSPSLFELSNIKQQINHIEGDIRNRDVFKDALTNASPDTIFHMAAQSLVRESYTAPVDTFDTNLTGTLNILEIARDIPALKALVVITTDKCYRNNELGQHFVETDPLGGKDPYSASKACAEIVTESYYQSFFKDSDTVISSVRAGNVIGGGDWADDRLIPDVVRSIQNNQSVLIRNPLSTRPWQHVLEPLFGYMLLAQNMTKDGHKFAGGWNFGPKETGIQPVGDVLEILGQTLQFKIELDSASHPYESKALGLDITKAKEHLGWTPYLSIKEAIDWTGQWYQEYLDGAEGAKLTMHQIEQYIEKIR